MSYSTVIRQGLFSVSIATVVVAASLGLPGTASAAELTHPPVLAAQTSPLSAPEACPSSSASSASTSTARAAGAGVLKGSSPGRCLNGAGGGLVDGGAQQYVSAVDVLVRLGWLAPTHVEQWRQGRLDCLERMVQANLSNVLTAMKLFRRWAARRNLVASETAYVARTRDRRPLGSA